MQMTSIEEWSPRPGEILEVVPTADALAAAHHAPVSTARPSLLQESHIRTAADRRAKGVDWSPWLAFAFRVPRPLDRDAWLRAANCFVTGHGTLLTWFDTATSENTSGDSHSVTLTRRAVDPEQVELELVSRGHAATSDEVRELVASRFSVNTSPLEWPAFVIGAIDHGEDGFTVYYGIDHSHTDGVSLLLGVEDLFNLYDHEAGGPSESMAKVGSYVDFSEHERAATEHLSLWSPAVRVWAKALFKVRNKLPSTAVELGLTPGETARSVRVDRVLVDGAQMADFEKACKSSGGGVSAGLFAILALIDVALAGRTSYLALNAVATRSDPAYRRAQGWFINLVPVATKVKPDATFVDLIPSLQKSIRSSRVAAGVPARAIVDRVARVGGVKVAPTAVPPIVSYIDMRSFPGGEHPVADEIHALGGPGNTGDLSMWINRRSTDTYTMVSFPDTEVARANVESYLGAIAALMAAVARGEVVDVAAAKDALRVPVVR
ncbi:condensation domain-containing protein [Rudaeicoccus suwonensis]|uniref:Condensation domain-containing protein n=1 Tax=Rudaeicoccus suwonensis TaxID=657409 RepID=A0A561DX54_9MICO|nr:condensation domain-containing protein [Rudaeicoccus suwonensis]TWE07955.1 condensation domain-containing protein [Rudaeicoccus suwonensis]